jgi:cation/acetate symporter
MPLGFFGAVLGTLLAGRDKENEARFSAFSLRVHAGSRGRIAAPEF